MLINIFPFSSTVWGRAVLAGLLLTGSPAVQAQPGRDGTPLTLPQALALAQTSYPALRARRAGIRAAEADGRTTRATYLPQVTAQLQGLNATANQVRGASISGVGIPVSGGIKTASYSSQTVWTSMGALLIEWPLVTFGRYRADQNRSAAAVSQAQADYDQELFNHQVQVTDAYLLALGAEKAVAIQRTNLVRARALGTVVRAGTASGIRPGIDSATTNAEIARARLLLLASQQQAQEQLTRLAGLLNQPLQRVQPDSMQFYTRLPRTIAGPLDTARLHPLLLAYQRRVAGYEAQSAALRANERPTFSLVGATWARGSGIQDRTNAAGGFDINPTPGAGLPFKAYDYLVGATLTWKITELIHSQYAVVAQNERVTQARAEYDQQALQLQSQQQSALLQLELARQTAGQAPIQLQAARQVYGQARARYDAGLDNLLILTQASAVLNRAETDQALAINNLWRTLLLRAATTGDLNLLLGQL